MRELIECYAERLSSAAVPVIGLVVVLSATLIAAEMALGRLYVAGLGLSMPAAIAAVLYRLRRRAAEAAAREPLSPGERDQAPTDAPSLCLALLFWGVKLDLAEPALDVVERRLRSQIRSGDRIVRNGSAGILILPNTGWSDLERSVQFAVRVQALCARTISLDGAELNLVPTIGFARNDGGPADAETLIARAEAAAEAAYLAGPGEIRGWTPAIQDDVTLRLAMKSALTKAFERNHIKPWFQPQISTDTGDVTGVEALARWEHPERGLVTPGEFLPYIASAGLSARLTRVMIDGALAALAAWEEAGLAVPQVSVNLSQQDLSDPGLTAMILKRLERHGIPPERLGLEVLESVATTDSDGPIPRNLRSLSAMGCFIDLDDFGTGTTSITTLKRLPIHRLKIDRSFVANVDTDRKQQGFVSATLTMAEQLGLDTLGEGVETAGEHTMLAQLGCGHVQGFGIGRPMPAAQIVDWAVEYRASLPDTRFTSPIGPDDGRMSGKATNKRGKTRQPPTGKTA